jgi:hypothetical protein
MDWAYGPQIEVFKRYLIYLAALNASFSEHCTFYVKLSDTVDFSMQFSPLIVRQPNGFFFFLEAMQ